MGKRTLIYRTCAKHAGTNSWEVWWDHDARTRVKIDVPSGNSCHFYNLSPGTLLDSWCDGYTMVKVFTVWDGEGRPPMGYDFGSGDSTREDAVVRVEESENALPCSENWCGLSILDVKTTPDERIPGQPFTFTITIVINDYPGEVEYTLNNFADVQSSPVFKGLEHGKYIAKARAKNITKVVGG